MKASCRNPLEAQYAMQSAAECIDAAVKRLATIAADAAPAATIPAARPASKGSFWLSP